MERRKNRDDFPPSLVEFVASELLRFTATTTRKRSLSVLSRRLGPDRGELLGFLDHCLVFFPDPIGMLNNETVLCYI